MGQKVKEQKRFRPKRKIKKGDTVVVIAGNDKGEQGRVLSIDMDKGRVIVEQVGLIKRHTKPNAAHPQGGIVSREASIHISNVMLIDPKTGDATRVGRKVENGKIVRYAKKSGEELS